MTLTLIDLDEAVALIRRAYARRTLQNLAWQGKLRHIGGGERMMFVPEQLRSHAPTPAALAEATP